MFGSLPRGKLSLLGIWDLRKWGAKGRVNKLGKLSKNRAKGTPPKSIEDRMHFMNFCFASDATAPIYSKTSYMEEPPRTSKEIFLYYFGSKPL